MILYLSVTANSLICKMEITGSSRWRHVQGPSPQLRALLSLLNALCPPWDRPGAAALNKSAMSSGAHIPQQAGNNGHRRLCLGRVGGARPEGPSSPADWLRLEVATSPFSPSPFSSLLHPSGPFLLPQRQGGQG